MRGDEIGETADAGAEARQVFGGDRLGVGDAQFGAQAQALRPLAGLQEGTARLG